MALRVVPQDTSLSVALSHMSVDDVKATAGGRGASQIVALYV